MAFPPIRHLVWPFVSVVSLHLFVAARHTPLWILVIATASAAGMQRQLTVGWLGCRGGSCQANSQGESGVGFAQISTIRTYVSTIDYSNHSGNVTPCFPWRGPLRYRTQPPWEFLLSASRNSLQSYELSRLSHAANLRKEIGQLLDSWLEENTAAMLARWLMEQRERPTEAPA